MLKFLTTFLRLPYSDTAYLWNETSHQQTKMLCQPTSCPLKADLLSVILFPETPYIRSHIVIHCMKIQHFHHCRTSHTKAPRVGPGYSLSAFAPPLSIHFLTFCSLLLFPFFLFLIHFTYFLPLLSIRSLSIRIVPLRFQAWGCRRRPNLGLVCFCVMIMLSVLLS